MGFLEDVKKDANAESTERVARNERQSETEFKTAVQPIMFKLHEYLRRLADHLDRLEHKQLISYELEGGKTLDRLRQCEFGLSVDNPDFIAKICFRYSCRDDRVEDVYAPNKEVGERRQQYMWHHRLQFSTKKTADERWHFKLQAFVPVTFDFELDPKRHVVKLKVTNHERLSTLTYTYAPDDVNELFLDELANYIMRKSNRFHELSGDVMPEDTLQRLREQVAERKAERASEGDQEQGESGGAVKGLFKGLFRR